MKKKRENEDDVMETIQLIEDLDNCRAFFVPLLFVPLESCLLKDQHGAELDSLSKARWELLTKCWEYNVRDWRSTFLECQLRNPLVYNLVAKLFLPSIGFISGLYYWRKHGEIVRKSIWKMAGIT